MDIRPSPDGGLTPGTRSEIRLKNQGIFQLVSLLEKTRERAVYMRRQMREEEETLRTLNPFTCCCVLIVLVSRICIAAGSITGRGHTCGFTARL
jgi:hypothetical protein